MCALHLAEGSGWRRLAGWELHGQPGGKGVAAQAQTAVVRQGDGITSLQQHIKKGPLDSVCEYSAGQGGSMKSTQRCRVSTGIGKG